MVAYLLVKLHVIGECLAEINELHFSALVQNFFYISCCLRTLFYVMCCLKRTEMHATRMFGNLIQIALLV